MASKTTKDINDSMNEKVSEPTSVNDQIEVIKKLDLKLDDIYIQADSFIGNPYLLLGSVLELRKNGKECPIVDDPQLGKLAFSEGVITNIKVDEDSKLKKPQDRGSIIVDQKLSLNVGFLNYLSSQVDNEITYSLMVIDQMAGMVDRRDGSWDDGLDKWKARNKTLIEDPSVCAIYVVFGFVQKYIIKKKFKKFKLGAKGGAMGVNIEGELYTSNEDFSLDIRYGLQTATIKRLPTGGTLESVNTKGLTAKSDEWNRPSKTEINILSQLAVHLKK